MKLSSQKQITNVTMNKQTALTLSIHCHPDMEKRRQITREKTVK